MRKLEIVEFSSDVRPTCGFLNAAIFTEVIESGVGIRLEDAMKVTQVLCGMLALAIRRVGEPHRRRRSLILRRFLFVGAGSHLLALGQDHRRQQKQWMLIHALPPGPVARPQQLLDPVLQLAKMASLVSTSSSSPITICRKAAGSSGNCFGSIATRALLPCPLRSFQFDAPTHPLAHQFPQPLVVRHLAPHRLGWVKSGKQGWVIFAKRLSLDAESVVCSLES